MKISSKIIEVLCFDTLFLENEIEKKTYEFIVIYCKHLESFSFFEHY